MIPATADPALRDQVTRIDMGLHSSAAWLLLVQHKSEEAEKHLAPLRKSTNKTFEGEAHLMEGLIAINEGRLEKGVRELEMSRQFPAHSEALYPYLGLSYGYMGLGKYDRALATEEALHLPERHSVAEAKLLAGTLRGGPPHGRPVHLGVVGRTLSPRVSQVGDRRRCWLRVADDDLVMAESHAKHRNRSLSTLCVTSSSLVPSRSYVSGGLSLRGTRLSRRWRTAESEAPALAAPVSLPQFRAGVVHDRSQK